MKRILQPVIQNIPLFLISILLMGGFDVGYQQHLFHENKPIDILTGYMEIIFGENETTGIDAFETAPAEVDMDAPVYDMTGRMIAPAMRNLAGKKLPRGMYVVNGVKIIVK